MSQLVSALLYHIVPGGAFTPEDLLAEGTLQTALPDYTLQVRAGWGSVCKHRCWRVCVWPPGCGDDMAGCAAHVPVDDPRPPRPPRSRRSLTAPQATTR
jgi:hypothetical protein